MEHAPEAWDCWDDEDFKLGPSFSADISDPSWNNFALQNGNDTVARSLFACTLQANDSSSGITEGSPSQAFCSWANAPHASESFLNLLAEEPVSSSPCLSDSFEGCDGSFANACKDTPSSHSLWFVPYDESLSSSPCNDVYEQSAESWMAGCLSDDKEVHAQGAMHQDSSSRDAMTSRAYSAGAQGIPCRASQSQGRKQLRVLQDSVGNHSGSNITKPRNARGKFLPKHKLGRSMSDSQALHGSAKPVVYPFALVKPSGIQGDATLKDINERINMLSSPQSRPCNTSCPSSSPFSGKPVVAVTKIHTEGKGTITIMRTRS